MRATKKPKPAQSPVFNGPVREGGNPGRCQIYESEGTGDFTDMECEEDCDDHQGVDSMDVAMKYLLGRIGQPRQQETQKDRTEGIRNYRVARDDLIV